MALPGQPGPVNNRVLKGRYRILEVIGRGGVATVYLGWDVMAERKVAIKVLKEEYTEHPEFPERFRREAEAVLQLADPRIVGFLDCGEEGGQHFLVMEHIEGKTLAQVVQEQGPLGIDEALDIACQVCDALETAHQKGVIHRDIKPQNLMLTPAGMVKVMDFGLARVATGVTLTQTGVFMGTPRYVSPEVVTGEQVDHRGDLYSLGIVLYEMLTGDIPFSTESTWALLQAHVQAIPPPVRKARPEVPEWLDAVLAKALAKDPAERFQSAAEFRAAIQAGRAEALTAPKPVGTSAALLTRTRWRWVAGAALGVVLLVSLGAWAAVRGGWFIRQAAPTPPGTEAVAVLPPTATPTATSAQQPTGGLSPTRSPTPTRTFTVRPALRPTARATSTPTPSRTPTATATPTRRPTATPTFRLLPQPMPLQPKEGEMWQVEALEFLWAWSGDLEAGEFFELRLLPAGGDPDAPVYRAWTREPRRLVDLSPLPGGDYLWGVWVVQGELAGEEVIVAEVLVAPQRLWEFHWGPPTDTPAPPRPRVTESPTPTPTSTGTPRPTPCPTRPSPTPTPRPPVRTPTPWPTPTPPGTPVPFTPPPKITLLPPGAATREHR